MGTMAMDRETELARFMDSHKAQAQTQAQYGNMHDQNTSLQLNSDNIEEKRQRLRQERHQDWRMQQEKPYYDAPPHVKESPNNPVYFKVGPPEEGLNLGQHDKQREHLQRQRQRDYLEYQKKQKDQADMKLRQRQMIQTQNPPAVPPPGQVDYDGQADLSRQEQRKAYQDYQRRKEQEMMDKKLHPPPPEKFSGLQIGEYDNYLKENGPKMKMQYKDMLDQQQKDDMFRRVKDEGAVLNRPPQQNQYGNPPSQYLANKPPPAPGHRMREDAFQTAPTYSKGQPYVASQGGRRGPGPLSLSRTQDIMGEGQFEGQGQSHNFLNPPPPGAARRSPRGSSPPMDSSRKNPVGPAGFAGYDYNLKEQVNKERREDFLRFQQSKMADEERRRMDRNMGERQQEQAPIKKDRFYGAEQYEEYKKSQQKDLGNEYRGYLKEQSKKVPNRSWKDDGGDGILIPEDVTKEIRKKELSHERQKDYVDFMSQQKGPPNHEWPEPNDGRGALLVKKGEYDHVRQMYDDQRKMEFIKAHEHKPQEWKRPATYSPPTKSEAGSEKSYFNPMVYALGRYDNVRQKLKSERHNDFKSYMDKRRSYDLGKRFGGDLPRVAVEETPVVYSMGKYEIETKPRVLTERRRDYAEYNSEQIRNASPRRQELLIPSNATAETPLVNHMGNYDKSKYTAERHRDCVEFSQKQKEKGHPPYENFVYPTMASSEKPVVESMGRELEQQRHRLRDERKREYEHYQLQMKTKENPRRTNAPQANGPYDGIFHGLGDRGNVQEHLTEERKSDFKQHLAKENQNYGPPARPDWALGVGEERGTHRGSPARNYDQGYDRPPPRDENRGGAQGGPPPPAQGGYRTPNYNDMLNDKRKEEAHRRRHDDPEYQMRLTSMDSRDRDNDREKMKDFQQQQPQRGY